MGSSDDKLEALLKIQYKECRTLTTQISVNHATKKSRTVFLVFIIHQIQAYSLLY